jgi:hypothetical protein
MDAAKFNADPCVASTLVPNAISIPFQMLRLDFRTSPAQRNLGLWCVCSKWRSFSTWPNWEYSFNCNIHNRCDIDAVSNALLGSADPNQIVRFIESVYTLLHQARMESSSGSTVAILKYGDVHPTRPTNSLRASTNVVEICCSRRFGHLYFQTIMAHAPLSRVEPKMGV